MRRANIAQWNACCYSRKFQFANDEVALKTGAGGTHVASIARRRCRKCVQHCDSWIGDGNGGADSGANARRGAYRGQSLRLVVIVAAASIATVPVLMVAHFSEVMVWSLAYAIVGAAPAGADPVYFAFVNYTTLGYGDVTPVGRWRLLGPITAMNAVLMFGWSTAVIFEVLRRTARHGA